MPISVECPSCGKRLKAPDSAAGKKAKCPQCGTPVPIPEMVYEAEEAEESYGFQDPSLDEYDAPEADDGRKPCPACGEMIMAKAAKCRFCGEIFDATLKRREKKRASRSSSDDDTDLSTGDWIFCILCAGIACIFGIVYAIQGKPKGAKMIGVAVAAAIFWNIIRFAILAVVGQ
ncbi:MAG: hypothetical protein ACKV0T_05245 [Planctomycetales bacterium]